jgi:membrane-bound acyltransferase YfiQ involved in biofilm formation
VWGRSGRHSFQREVLPFWMLAVLGLVASTLLAALADRTFGQQIWINVGSLAGYFVVWLFKFYVLDTMLFAGSTRHGGVVAR